MCHKSCVEFVHNNLNKELIESKCVLEVGSRDVNGSVRDYIESLSPSEYIGCDIEAGGGVDEICDVENLVDKYGNNSFDVVISTEMLEHVEDWKSAINNMKDVLKVGGIIIITTRSPGFEKHENPNDYWRFTKRDMEKIFEDYLIIECEDDKQAPGIFIHAIKSSNEKASIDYINVHSMEENNDLDITNFKLAISVPLTFPMVASDFFESFVLMEKGYHIFFRAKGGSIEILRNGLVELAQKHGCTHLIMLDADMYYHFKTIPRLLAHNKDVVGALCFRRCPPFEPFMMKDNEYILDWEKDSLVEVDKTGTGCLLINMKVFDSLKKPYFQTVTDDEGKVIQGEDYNFCDKVKEAGHDIFVDTSVEAEHLSSMRVNTEWFKFWQDLTNKKEEVISHG